jgi:hypothetical protein
MCLPQRHKNTKIYKEKLGATSCFRVFVAIPDGYFGNMIFFPGNLFKFW